MKKINLLLITCFVLGTAFVEFKSPPANYRDGYVGSYFCIRNCQAVNAQHNALIGINDTITINIAKDVTDSVLDISVNHIMYKMKLMNSKLYSEGIHGGGKFFSSDSVSFIPEHGLGPNNCIYIGKKK